MECPKCGHRIPDNDEKCLYCGARTRGEPSSERKTEPSVLLSSSGKTGKNFTGFQTTKEEINYKKLEELPLSLRLKVEEMLKKGDGQNVEIKTFSHNFPESTGRTGEKRKKMGFLAALKILLKKD
jgi:hypothetical protein